MLGWAINVLVGIDTNLLWFRAVGHESAYTRRFWTEALLFATFGSLMAAMVAHTLVVVVRQRPDFNPDPTRQRWRYVFSRIERRLRKVLFVVIVGALSLSAGAAAASGWQTWLLWRNQVPVGRVDPQFHRDISYFLFTYPQHRMVLTLLFRVVGTAVVVLLLTAYAYGALRVRGKGPRLTRALQIHLSALLGLYLLLKVFGYWLDRLATATSNRGVVTGPAYTDIHAVLPGKLALVGHRRGLRRADVRQRRDPEQQADALDPWRDGRIRPRRRRRAPATGPAVLGEAERGAGGEAVHRPQHQRDAHGLRHRR